MKENNILPKQVASLYTSFKEMSEAQNSDEEGSYEQAVEEGIVELKEEWGNAFNDKILAAQRAFSTYGNEDISAYLDETGLGNNPMILKLFAEIGASLGEDAFKGQAKTGANTPVEAQGKIDAIMDNSEHPYHIQGHMGHTNAVNEVEKLFEDLTRQA